MKASWLVTRGETDQSRSLRRERVGLETGSSKILGVGRIEHLWKRSGWGKRLTGNVLHHGGRRRYTHPPQSHRFSIRFPKNLIWLCSTSIVAPSRRTSLATKLLKIILRIEDLPEPDLPMSKTFFLAGLDLAGAVVDVVEVGLLVELSIVVLAGGNGLRR